MARPAYTYRGHRRYRHFRDGAPFIRLSGTSWRRPFDDRLIKQTWNWPRRMLGAIYRYGGRAFWDKLKPQILAHRREQAKLRAHKG